MVYAYTPNFLGLYIREKLQTSDFTGFFQLQHSVVVPPSNNAETKLNACAQLQFPYPMISKPFPCLLKRFHDKVINTTALKSVIDQKKQKTSNFVDPRQLTKYTSSTKFGVRGDHSCISKTFSDPTDNFAARGAKYLGGKRTPRSYAP